MQNNRGTDSRCADFRKNSEQTDSKEQVLNCALIPKLMQNDAERKICR